MRQGNFSEVSTRRSGTRSRASPSPATSSRRRCCRRCRWSCCTTIPAPNLPGIASNLQATRPTRDKRSAAVPRRPEPGQQDPAVRALQLARHLHQHVEADAASGHHAAAHQQEHARLLHAHAVAEPAQRLPHRLSPHRFRHAELLRRERHRQRRHGARDPGLRRRRRFNNPGIPTINISNFSGLGGGGTNWYQFDTTFQVSNVLAWTSGSHNIRTGFDLRRLATGRRAANDPRGRFDFTGDISGYSVADFMLGLPRTVLTRSIRSRATSAAGATASSSTTSGRRRAT